MSIVRRFLFTLIRTSIDILESLSCLCLKNSFTYVYEGFESVNTLATL